ncbi:MAG: TolC family protein [Thermodesulfobacteriota bacterium]
MIRRKLAMGCLAALLFLAQAAWAGEAPAGGGPLTLNACLVKGLVENPQIRAYELGVGEAREDVRGAWGAFLPTLGASYNKNWLTNDTVAERNNDYLDQTSDNTTYSISQPLFTGFGGIAGVKDSKLALESREHELRYMRLRLAREIRRDFHAVLYGEALVRLWQGSVERLRRQKEIAQAWYDRQLVNRLRLLEVEVELSSAIQQQQEAASALAVARARLAHWLALPSAEALPTLDGTLDQEEEAAPFPATLEESLTEALAARPDLKIAELSIGRAKAQVIQVASRSLPQASVQASWTDYQRDYDNARYTDELRDYYTVGIQVSIRPFDGGRNIFAWRKQRLTVEKMRQQRLDTEKTIDTEVRSGYTLWQDSGARLQTATDTLRQAEDAWKLASRALELGVGSLKEQLDAELRLTRAEISRLDAQLYRQRARAELRYALGRAEK